MKKKEHMKIMNKATINIYFKDGKMYELQSKFWDDYQYLDRLFVVKRRGVWIGIYNMDAVDCIVIDELL